MFELGDRVFVNSNGFYLGKGLIVSFTKGNAKLSNVETFDGTRYSLSDSEMTKIED